MTPLRNLEFDAAAFEDLSWWVEHDRAQALRIIRLIRDVQRDPFRGSGKPIVRARVEWRHMSFDDYKVVLYRNQPDGWVAEIPAIAGCHALMPTAAAAFAELPNDRGGAPRERQAHAARHHRNRPCLAPAPTTSVAWIPDLVSGGCARREVMNGGNTKTVELPRSPSTGGARSARPCSIESWSNSGLTKVPSMGCGSRWPVSRIIASPAYPGHPAFRCGRARRPCAS